MNKMRWLTAACLVGAVLAWGCSPTGGDKEKKAESDKHAKADKGKESEHEHHEPGPHGGALEDFGRDGKHHVEVVFDRDKKEATVYVLGEDEKTAKPIKSEKLTLTLKDPDVRVELKPQPQAGEKDGLSSRFVGGDEKLGGKGAIVIGSVTGEIAGKPDVAEYKEGKVEPKK